ncbi:MAG: thioredoxin [Acidobacteria bacterium]|nr:thioredoxin [Acidobacteriota bacterium]
MQWSSNRMVRALRNEFAPFSRSLSVLALASITFLSTIAPVIAEEQPAPSAMDKPIALVDGKPILESELVQQTRPQMQQLRNQEYDVKRQALDGMVNQKLVEAEAARQNMGVAELIARDVDSKVRETTEEEINAYYAGQKDRIGRPIEEVKDQIAAGLKQNRGQQARQDYIAVLRKKLPVEIFLEPIRLNVQPDLTRLRGPVDAPITIVEFSDFQCPYCLKAYPTVRAVLGKYADKVRFSYRDFPLRNIHGQAQEAAEAARCAGDQNKYWQFHDVLFESPSDLTREKLLEAATKLSLDTASLELCIESGKYRNEVEKDYQEGLRAGISGTPAFYINGIFLNGSQPASAFEQVIESELARLGQRVQPVAQ